MTIYGKQIAFGTKHLLPLRGFPPGQRRIRLRNKETVTVFVRDDSGIRAWRVREVNGHWEPDILTGQNLRP